MQEPLQQSDPCSKVSGGILNVGEGDLCRNTLQNHHISTDLPKEERDWARAAQPVFYSAYAYTVQHHLAGIW